MTETRVEKAVSWTGWALLIIMALLMMSKTALTGKALPEEDSFWSESSFAESMSSDDSEVSTNG